MKIFVQFLKAVENNVNPQPITGKNEISILDERKSLNTHIIEAFELIEKHEQKDEIVGFNIISEDSFRNKSEVLNQNIFAY